MEDIKNRRYGKALMLKDLNIVEDSVETENSIMTHNTIQADLLFTDNSKWTADIIYYDLPLPESFKDNPFKNEIRIFPVDFGYGFTTHLVYEIKLPENYRLQEKAEDILLKLPDGSASFMFQTTQSGPLLNIQVKLDIKNPLIAQENYPDLREFFSKMVNHCQQPYVLVKTP